MNSEIMTMSNLSNSRKIILQWKTMISLQNHFSLSNNEMSILVDMSESEYQDGYINLDTLLTENQLDRLSCLMSIRASLLNIFSKDEDAYAWIRLPSSDNPFKGNTPIDYILANEDNLMKTVAYLESSAL